MRLVMTNVPSDRADAMARDLVGGGHAACVSAFPVRSTYRWKGQLEVASETTLLIKVAAELVPALRRVLRELHPYELPEFLVLPVEIESSLAEYVRWVREAR